MCRCLLYRLPLPLALAFAVHVPLHPSFCALTSCLVFRSSFKSESPSTARHPPTSTEHLLWLRSSTNSHDLFRTSHATNQAPKNPGRPKLCSVNHSRTQSSPRNSKKTCMDCVMIAARPHQHQRHAENNGDTRTCAVMSLPLCVCHFSFLILPFLPFVNVSLSFPQSPSVLVSVRVSLTVLPCVVVWGFLRGSVLFFWRVFPRRCSPHWSHDRRKSRCAIAHFMVQVSKSFTRSRVER